MNGRYYRIYKCRLCGKEFGKADIEMQRYARIKDVELIIEHKCNLEDYGIADLQGIIYKR